jgi:hypothetical protein
MGGVSIAWPQPPTQLDALMMERKRILVVGKPLAVNLVVSWAILPFAIPPFGGYSLHELFEVILWQGICTVGWPFAALGVLLSLPFGLEVSHSWDFLLIMIYPAILVLLIRALFAKVVRILELLLLHFFVAFSFVAVWYRVLNGYDFMVG